MAQQMTIEDAMRARDAGIAAAQASTERMDPGWKDVALAFIAKYAMAKRPREQFTTEDVVDAYKAGDLMPPPKGDKAWGGVIQTAQRKGFIAKVRDEDGNVKTLPRRKGHCSPGPVFVSLIAGKRATEVLP